MQTRREALKIIGAVGVTCAFPFSANELYGQHVHNHEALQEAQPPAPKFFNPAQLLVISRLTDLIIPPTDTPGAAAAGVPAYIDLVVNEDPALQATFREGLPRLDAHLRIEVQRHHLPATHGTAADRNPDRAQRSHRPGRRLLPLPQEPHRRWLLHFPHRLDAGIGV